MTDKNERYYAQLSFWLRVNGIDGPRIISILSDVRAHVTDSAEDPNVAFGSPRSYAKEFSKGKWAWARTACGVYALGGLTGGVFLAADELAHLGAQRQLCWTSPNWLVGVVAILLILSGWRAALFFSSRSLVALANEGFDAQKEWKSRRRRRRFLSVGLAIVVVAVTWFWGATLSHSYLETPKLAVTSYVNSTSNGEVRNGSYETVISARTVIFLSAPGSATSFMSAYLSPGRYFTQSLGSSLQGFDSVAPALESAMQSDWGVNTVVKPGFSLRYGSFYVLSWSGSLPSGFTNAPPSQESLVVIYRVAGIGQKKLTIPLSVNS